MLPTHKDSRLWMKAPEMLKETKNAGKTQIVGYNIYILSVFHMCTGHIGYKSNISSFWFPSTVKHLGHSSKPTIEQESHAGIVKSNRKRSLYFCKTLLSVQQQKLCMAVYLGSPAPLHCPTWVGWLHSFPQWLTRASLFVRAMRRCFWVCWVKSSI